MFALTRIQRRWRVIELLKWGEGYFSSHGFDSPRREIEWLLTCLLSSSRLQLYLDFERIVHAQELETLRSWVKRRISGEPLQYITGKTEFFGLPIRVNRHVLIPRPETERLVEVAVDLARKIRAERIVDMGTGSGCISIALATRLNRAEIVAVDKDETTLEIARSNARLNGVETRVSFQKADILSDTVEGRWDMLVSNPPYVPKNEFDKLMPEVRDFEPTRALTDGGDGLVFYRQFAAKGRDWVRNGGYLIVEVGLGSHPQRVKSLFQDARFETVTLYQDYNGDDRVAAIEVT